MNRAARSVPLALQGIGLVYGWIHLAAQIVVAAVTDDPNDLVVAVARVVEAKPAAYGVLVRKVHPCEHFVDDDSLRARMHVGPFDRPARNDWHPHGLEKAVGNPVQVRAMRVIPRAPRKVHAPVVAVSRQQPGSDQAHSSDARQFGQFVTNAKDIRPDAFSRVSRAGGIHGRVREILTSESKLGGFEIRQRSAEKACRDESCQTEGDLERYECARKAESSAHH
jgi:hypothetical protein